MVFLLGTPYAMAMSSDYLITYEAPESASGCRLINISGPYGANPQYYRMARLCHGNEGEYVLHYDIPVITK